MKAKITKLLIEADDDSGSYPKIRISSEVILEEGLIAHVDQLGIRAAIEAAVKSNVSLSRPKASPAYNPLVPGERDLEN